MFKIAIVLLFIGLTVLPIKADESVKEKVEEIANDSNRAAKAAGREIKDKTCELVNGKMKCVLQEAKHAVQNAADKVEDAID
jgi:hypothetical protein